MVLTEEEKIKWLEIFLEKISSGADFPILANMLDATENDKKVEIKKKWQELKDALLNNKTRADIQIVEVDSKLEEYKDIVAKDK